MAKQSDRGKTKAPTQEPLLLVRPVAKGLGLDWLHIMLIVLVIVVAAFAFAVSALKPGIVVSNCTYGPSYNGTCATPVHNGTQALTSGEQILASYATVNSSISLIAYYSIPSQANVSYLPSNRQWLVQVPYIDPLSNNQTFMVSMLLWDSNLSLVQPFIQTIKPLSYTQNRVVSQGVVSIYGKTACAYNGTIPVYSITDPYAPGAMQALFTAINASSFYGNSINVSYKFVATSYTDRFLAGYPASAVGAVGAGLFCASMQPNSFLAFMKNFSLIYTGEPLANYTILQVAEGSGLNVSDYNACITNSSTALYYQAQLAKFYSIQTTPVFVVNCQYETIPQTLGLAINYTLAQQAK